MESAICSCGQRHPSQSAFPPGHAYSPIPCAAAVERSRPEYERMELPGVDLQTDAQLRLLESLELYAAGWTEIAAGGRRFQSDNEFFGGMDALFYACMLRHLHPARVVEVGCGHSSALLLDVNETFLRWSCDCTFIEPEPRCLLPHMLDEDRERVTLLPRRLEDVPFSVFAALGPGDILFIDSSHVCKAGSDVQLLFFSVLPLLRPGVVVHVHDIFYPFEYPHSWLSAGRYWNEAYMLRAFLTGNTRARILLFASYLSNHHRNALAPFPVDPARAGGSLWFEVTGGTAT